MDDLQKQFIFLVNTIWRGRAHALAVAWLVCLAGWAVVAFMPNFYTSNARLLVDSSNVLRPLLKGIAVENDIEAQLEMMTETLTSRPNLAAVARLTDLDLQAPTPSDMDRLLDSLAARTKVAWDGTKLLSIAFTDADPVRARDVVQALVTTFIDKNLGNSRKDMEAARQFLDVQIQEYERQLEQAEQRLAAFKQERLSKFPNREDIDARLEDLQNQLVDAEAALRKASSQRKALLSHLSAPQQAEANSRLPELESSLRDLLTRYTEQHPEVIALRRQIATVRAEEAARERRSAEADGTAANGDRKTDQSVLLRSASDETKTRLATYETDMAFYREKAARIRQRYEKLESQKAKLPELEAELARLNRDYEVIKLKYEELISRREQARISRERETRVDDVEFRVVDPPRVPGAPDGPSRSILLSVALVFGFGAGGVFSVVFALMRETYSHPARLKEQFGLPVLGSVSNIGTFREHSRRVARGSMFFGGLLLLFAVYAGLLLVDRQVGLANVASTASLEDAFQDLGPLLHQLRDTLVGFFDRG